MANRHGSPLWSGHFWALYPYFDDFMRKFRRDNGSEFINDATELWCRKESIHFTRSRFHKKNDTCFVEQKNGAVVREYVGYYRLEGEKERDMAADIYHSLAPLLNFFMPTQKLVSKTRIGSKESKVYDAPTSPFQRLMDLPLTSDDTKKALLKQIALYNPVELQDNVNKAILHLMQRLAQPNRKSYLDIIAFSNIFYLRQRGVY